MRIELPRLVFETQRLAPAGAENADGPHDGLRMLMPVESLAEVAPDDAYADLPLGRLGGEGVGGSEGRSQRGDGRIADEFSSTLLG